MAKKTCVPCLGSEMKLALRETITDKDMRTYLDTVPECESASGIEMCLGKKVTGSGSGSKPAKGKRAPSAYNLFVKECMKSRPKDKPATEHMKTCATQYKAKKAQ